MQNRFVVLSRTKTQENVNISWHSLGTLCRIQGNINAQKYIDILDTHIRNFPPNNYVFQDDIAPLHRARVVEEYKHANNIRSLVWPAQSPEINIIENCWHRIKRTIQYHSGEINPRSAVRSIFNT